MNIISPTPLLARSPVSTPAGILSAIRPALVLIVAFTALTGLALPLGFVGLGRAVMPYQAGGSLIERGGK